MQTTSTVRRFNFKRVFVGDGPQAPPYLLNNRRVYILPTKQGLVFALLLFAMLLGSINYNNNLGYILTFLLASLTVVTIFMTYRNMLFLRIGPATSTPVFAGKHSTIPVQIDNQQYSSRFAIEYHLPKATPVICDIPANADSTIQLPVTFAHRGIQALPRFVIETTFPLGLFRAWSHVELQQSVLVYPLLFTRNPETTNCYRSCQRGKSRGESIMARGMMISRDCGIIRSGIHFIGSIGNPRPAIMYCKPNNILVAPTVNCGLIGRILASPIANSESRN